MELFRREVREARQQNWLGSVHLTAIKAAWPLAAGIALLAVVIVLFLCFGVYTRSEQTMGHLVPSQGLLPVSSTASGVITEALIREGETVSQNQPLLEISSDRDTRAIGGVGAAIAIELEIERARLKLKLDGLTELEERERVKLQQRMDHLQRQLDLADAQLQVRERQLLSARELQERIQPLKESRQLSALQIQQYEFSALDAEAQLQGALLQHLNTLSDIAALQTKLDELPLRTADARREMEQKLSELNRTIAHNERDRSVIMRAPRAGVISGLNVALGQSVQEGQLLLAIIPEGSELNAELWVSASAVGRIDIDTLVAMRYHAYPYQQYGQQYGRIIEIGHRALRPDEIRMSTGFEVMEPAYRVLVAPESQFVYSEGRNRPLRASMTLDAAMLLDQRRLFELLGFNLHRSPTQDPGTELLKLNGASLER